MIDLLYWEWFKEKWAKEPWGKIESACNETWRKFSKLILPGSPDYNWAESYSMTASKNMFFEAFQDIRNETSIAVYSLSCWPALLALIEVLKEYPDLSELIKSVLFIHPAKDPLHAVRIMDWILRLWEWNIKSWEYFLNHTPEVAYKTVIDGWRWHWKQFQMDLNLWRKQEQFDLLVDKLEKSNKIWVSQLINPKDFVTNWKMPELLWWKWALHAMSLHRPKQSWEKLLQLCS